MVDSELLSRADYQEPGQRRRGEYRLTEKGRDLLPVSVALLQWGDRWTSDPMGPPIVLEHRGCGAAIGVAIVCRSGHKHLPARELKIRAGPGAQLV